MGRTQRGLHNPTCCSSLGRLPQLHSLKQPSSGAEGIVFTLAWCLLLLLPLLLCAQITRIVSNIRPDRQTVMFSATFPRAVETLARQILNNPVEIQVCACVCVDTWAKHLRQQSRRACRGRGWPGVCWLCMCGCVH